MIFFARCVLLLAAIPLFAADDSVRVENGLLTSVAATSPEVRVFKGIPYARPPVGDLRWRAPQPATAWKGRRKATKFSICYQTPYPGEAIFGMEPEPMSEDCLYLNVRTAAQSAKQSMPVMV